MEPYGVLGQKRDFQSYRAGGRGRRLEGRTYRFARKRVHRNPPSLVYRSRIAPDGRQCEVLNLVEGREAIVESPTGGFEPFVVHYAETFIVPESVKEYTIRPCGESEGKQCATIKAFVKHNP